ncbi:hypothetical protein Z045_09315 [Rhodococcus pyridinivorans KG-16]|uniref:Uncharacterized protein n=1 Tax=Rhodococcus pyridinivorans KG-16 TaxID=1441730 RepID=A0A0V9ULC3_9NOCA|nr:hypothetical protein Z045_09315 [Rhodococcus pyridinivorans KG-16]
MGAGIAAADDLRRETPVALHQVPTFLPEPVERLGANLRKVVQGAEVPSASGQLGRVEPGECAQAHLGRKRGVEIVVEFEGRFDGVLEQRDEDVVLRREVVVQRCLPDSHRLGDRPCRRGGEPAGGEQLRGGVEDLGTRGRPGPSRRVEAGASWSCMGHLSTVARRKALQHHGLHA